MHALAFKQKRQSELLGTQVLHELRHDHGLQRIVLLEVFDCMLLEFQSRRFEQHAGRDLRACLFLLLGIRHLGNIEAGAPDFLAVINA